MITILHGEAVSASRNELVALRDKYKGKEILSLDGKKASLTEIKQALEASSMFTTERVVIIENLLSAKKSQKQQEIVSYLEQNPPRNDLLLWDGDELSKSTLAKFPLAKINYFKPEPVIFKFLESIRPRNQSGVLRMLKLSSKKEAIEIVFYMLIRQFRLLLLIKDGVVSGVEEVDRLADWKKERLSRQASYFNLEKLTDIYHQLLEIDYQQKTGQAAFDLQKTLELFVAKL